MQVKKNDSRLLLALFLAASARGAGRGGRRIFSPRLDCLPHVCNTIVTKCSKAVVQLEALPVCHAWERSEARQGISFPHGLTSEIQATN